GRDVFVKTKRITVDYVKMFYQLSHKGEVRCCRLAEWLSVSRSTVAVSIKALSEVGLVCHDDFKNIHLTEQGLKVAREVEARHRVLYELLITLGVDERIASIDACKMEHALGEDSFQALQSLLSNPK